MSNNILDAGIPVLTEIIPAPTAVAADASDDTGATTTTGISGKSGIPVPMVAIAPDGIEPEVLVTDAIVTLEPRAATVWDEAEWERMEREVRERVLIQVLERVDFVLEQRVRDSLADVLQLAVERLANEIREGLHHSIKDVVSRAVTHEITKLQSSKK